MAINGKLPRFLSKMNFALADYDTSFNCDWQAIAIKYVQLSFQVRNLNYWIQATTKRLQCQVYQVFFRKEWRMLSRSIQKSHFCYVTQRSNTYLRMGCVTF